MGFNLICRDLSEAFKQKDKIGLIDKIDAPFLCKSIQLYLSGN
jgi:hypothetical protein